MPTRAEWTLLTVCGALLAGSQVETDWFAPAVKRLVRREIRSYGFTSAKTTSAVIYERVDELVSFRLAQTSP